MRGKHPQGPNQVGCIVRNTHLLHGPIKSEILSVSDINSTMALYCCLASDGLVINVFLVFTCFHSPSFHAFHHNVSCLVSLGNVLSGIWIVIFELIRPSFYRILCVIRYIMPPCTNITCVDEGFRRHSILNNPIALSKTLHCAILLCGQSQIPNLIQNANEKI